ncbi:MAG: hypothetical protein QM760_04225 [Nibricoccus sp.]
MGSALYIVAKKAVPEIDMTIDGKTLAASEEELSAICARAGVKGLMEFFSQNPEELAALLGEEVPGVPPEQWFDAGDGLVTVRTLLSHLESDGKSHTSARAIEDLKRCDRVLAELQKRKISWHFALDI